MSHFLSGTHDPVLSCSPLRYYIWECDLFIPSLAKDFAIHLSKDKEEEIKKATLGQTIKNYIKDENVKSMAELATWLGNDEAHYIRKWEDKDIEDLKRLIRLTVNAIENALLMEEYKKDMKSSKS
jgi:hypothetical protein